VYKRWGQYFDVERKISHDVIEPRPLMDVAKITVPTTQYGVSALRQTTALSHRTYNFLLRALFFSELANVMSP